MLPQLPNRHGVYTQPGQKGVTGARRFGDWCGVPVSQMLDFTPTQTWQLIANPYALDSYRGMGMRLELSVPMLCDDPRTTLEDCAAGAYNDTWNKLAKNLVVRGLADTVIRPGHEMNGHWYRWSARGHEEAYAAAFRQIVTVMRNVPGQAFPVDWNPAVGMDLSDATLCYPGDDVVDVIGLDVYDTSAAWYPVKDADDQLTSDPVIVETRRHQVWRQLYCSYRGLAFWAGWARDHGKPLALTEWAVTWDRDERCGNDNPSFVDRMATFIGDPRNNVAYSHYFDIDTPNRAHVLSNPATTRFPLSAARYLARVSDIARPL